MQEQTLDIALVQMQMHEDRTENDRRAVAAIREGAARGAKLVCLPELFRSHYFCQTEDADLCDLAEPIPGPTTERYAALAQELGIDLVLSLFERRAAGVYHNTAVVLEGQHTAGMYRKMHIPDDPRYYEKYYFTPGDLGFRTISTRRCRLGVLVCWDQWFPEAARLTALQGAEVLIYPTAIGWHPEEKAAVGDTQRDAWRTIQRSHAIANGCYVAAINRWGFEPTPGRTEEGIEFFGSSFVTAPDGAVIAEAPVAGSQVLLARLDLGAIERQRRGWPFLRDRRIDAYGGLGQRFGR